MSNITKESQEQQPKKIKPSDKKWIKDYVKEHFGESVNFVYEERMLKLCDNSVLNDPKFLTLLQKFQFWILPSLF